MGNIIIGPFNGDQAVADAVAALHLKIRLGQRKDGTGNHLGKKLYSSQADLKGMADFYVKPGGNFWIARDSVDGRIVGFVGLKHKSQGVGHLKRMAIIPEYRRQGIGRELVQALVAWAKEHGFAVIILGTGKTEKAHDLYLSEGFVDTGFSEGGNDYHMQLDLTKYAN